MTPLVREMVALAPDMAEQMHWFDCGTAPEGILVNLDSVNDNPLPYGQCAVCGMDDAGGKPPALFDWRTVVIAPPPEPGPPKGGTHASPRLHDRRGHWRNHPSGKQVWVKACKVGDAAKGVIFKDYEVKP